MYQKNHVHGFMVISAIAAVARDVEVIFVDLDHTTPQYGSDPYGFELGEYKIYTITNYGDHMIDEMMIAYKEYNELGNKTISKWYTRIKIQREKMSR